jgi:hypothetical protein
MSDRIEKLKAELQKAYREELSEETVKVTLTLNSYGFFTEIKERTSDSLKKEGVNMRNLKMNWIQ